MPRNESLVKARKAKWSRKGYRGTPIDAWAVVHAKLRAMEPAAG